MPKAPAPLRTTALDVINNLQKNTKDKGTCQIKHYHRSTISKNADCGKLQSEHSVYAKKRTFKEDMEENLIKDLRDVAINYKDTDLIWILIKVKQKKFFFSL